jgi:hypothetical protein
VSEQRALTPLRTGRRVARSKPASLPEPVAKQRIIAMRLRQDAWKQVKIATVERGTTARYLMIEALNDWFAKHGKPPIA